MDLPIRFRTARAWMASIPCPIAPLAKLLPDRSLRAVSVLPGLAPLAVAVFHCEDTSVGAHNEVVLGFPVRHRKSAAVPLVPLLAERWLVDLGIWVHVLAVDTEGAAEAARAEWGLPAIVARIAIDARPDRVTCSVANEDGPLLNVDIDRPTAPSEPQHFPLRLWTKREAELLRTDIDVDALGTLRRVGARAKLALEHHPAVATFPASAIARAAPLEVRWLDTYHTALGAPTARFLADAR